MMHQGAASAFYIDESKVSEITVNSMPGQYYEALIDGDFNTLTWLDTQESVQFILESPEDFSFLMDLAQSVKKIE